MIGSDPVALPDVLALLDRQIAEGAWSFGSLHDARHVTWVPTPEDIRTIVAYVDNNSKTLGPRGPVAFVAAGRTVLGIARMYAHIREGSAHHAEIFQDIEAATPWHGRNKRLDPTRSMTSWRTAWRNIRKAAGLPHVRFHDGRHTAITTLAEKGLPDWVIQAQVGHVAPEMMKTYSHIRRQALNQAAAALEPTQNAAPGPVPPPSAVANAAASQEKSVMSQPTSQNADRGGRVLKFAKKSGSPHWTISATTSSVQRNRLQVQLGGSQPTLSAALASGSLSPAAARSAPFRLAALDDFAPGSSKPPDVETKGRFPASVRPMALPSGQNRRARTSPMTMALESPKPEEAWQLYVRALDATTGKKIWDYQQVSSFHYGPGVLSTAGGLVFAGEHKGQVSALDARTGRSLWHFNTGDLITSSPISYAIDGQQYIAISSGTNVFAFALP